MKFRKLTEFEIEFITVWGFLVVLFVGLMIFA